MHFFISEQSAGELAGRVATTCHASLPCRHSSNSQSLSCCGVLYDTIRPYRNVLSMMYVHYLFIYIDAQRACTFTHTSSKRVRGTWIRPYPSRTPTVACVWIFLGTTQFPAISSRRPRGQGATRANSTPVRRGREYASHRGPRTFPQPPVADPCQSAHAR